MILAGIPPNTIPRRILLLQLRRIGDTLLGTPAIRALAHAFPEAKIDFIAEYPANEALIGNPYIDRLLVPKQHGILELLKFIRELRREKYDWAIDFMSNPRSAQFAFASGAHFRYGLDRFGRRWAYNRRALETEEDLQKYAVDLRLDMLNLIGIPSAGRHLELFADRADKLESTRIETLVGSLSTNQSIVAIASGGWIAAKRYPAHLTAELAARVTTAGYTPIVTIGPGETEFAAELRQVLAPDILLIPEARVSTLAALYRRASIYIGPDSAPKHIAVACGIPTITLFGPGNPGNWNDSENPQNIVLMPDCTRRPDCIDSECIATRCLDRITPESIVTTASSLLAENKKKNSAA